jgi:hypothetical protein
VLREREGALQSVPLLVDVDRPRLEVAVESSGIDRPARIYDLRSTFASNALAAA